MTGVLWTIFVLAGVLCLWPVLSLVYDSLCSVTDPSAVSTLEHSPIWGVLSIWLIRHTRWITHCGWDGRLVGGTSCMFGLILLAFPEFGLSAFLVLCCMT